MPTDETPAAAAADRAVAVAVARRFDTPLRVLCVAGANVSSTMDAGMANVIDSLERDGQRAVESVREATADSDVPVETEVRRGRVHPTIGARAAETDTDPIVMRTHGRQGLDRTASGVSRNGSSGPPTPRCSPSATPVTALQPTRRLVRRREAEHTH